MKTSTVVGVVAALVVAVGAWYWLIGGAPAPAQNVLDYKNATYVIEGQPVALVDGRAETPAAPGSASMVVTQYFGNEATGDLNGDGTPDVVFLLTQNSGGSGTFYYVVAALETAGGYEGTSAVLLGDRVAPQTTEIRDGQVIVNYAERRADEPMTARPSIGVSKYLKVEGTTLVLARPVVGAGERCGGNMMNAPLCALGYHCAPTLGSNLPFGDVGGTCIAN
jgi:hypothetical protein